jgi:hypothetical protein
MTDPVVYLAPIPVLVGLGQAFPVVEHVCNVVIGGGLLVSAGAGLVVLAWQWWGPRPEQEGDTCLRRVEREQVRRG